MPKLKDPPKKLLKATCIGGLKFKKKRDNYTKKKINKLEKYLRNEFATSTTHGLPYIVNTELHWFERMFWFVCFVCSTAVIFTLLSVQYRRFMVDLKEVYVSLFKEAPTLMSVEMDYYNWNVSYPAIYLCSLNKSDDDFLLSSFTNQSIEEIGTDLEQYVEAIVSTTLESVNLIQVPNSETLSLINSSDYATIAANTFKKLSSSMLTTLAGSWTVSTGISMTEMGMCNVLNSNVAVFDNPLKWSDPDATYAQHNVEVSFYDGDFFVELMNYADSYKIYLQSPNDIIQTNTPFSIFEEDGFLQFEVQMSTTRATKDLRSLPVSLRRCRCNFTEYLNKYKDVIDTFMNEIWPSKYQALITSKELSCNLFYNRYQYRFVDEPDSSRYPVYSYNRCLIQCRIRMIVKLCGCVPHFYKPLPNERVCNLAELKCVGDYKKEIMAISTSNKTMKKFEDTNGLPRNSRDCGCLDNCEYTLYKKDNEEFLPQMLLNRLRIGVAPFSKVRIRREMIVGFHDIIVRGGGVVNLFLGASFISVMELLMSALRPAIYGLVKVFRYIYTRKQKTKAGQKKKIKISTQTF